MTTGPTSEFLRQIRDGIGDLRRDVNQRLDQTNERLDQTNERLDQTNSRLGRVEQGLVDLGKFMRQIALDQAKYERFHAHYVERLDGEFTDLQERVQQLEQRAIA